MPDYWRTAVIVPLYKSEWGMDKMQELYSGNNLLSVVGKSLKRC